MNRLTRGRIRAAFAIAIGADILQLALFPLFAEGIASPLDAALDSVVCVALTVLVGWNYAFLPGFILEMVPMIDLVPTWTLAALIATRAKPASDVARPAPAGEGERSADTAPVIEVEASVTDAAGREPIRPEFPK